MKKMTFKIYMAACCAAVAFSACSEEDATLHGVAPAKIGTISLNTGKDQVRPGQPLTASIALPTGGQNISEATYTWGSLNYPSEKEENGTAYLASPHPKNRDNTVYRSTPVTRSSALMRKATFIKT